jgi:hypothetical protein
MKHVLAVVVLVVLLLFLLSQSVFSDPYLYDEADYMYTASLGYLANYTDTPTLALTDFLRIGLGRGREAGKQRDLSEFIRKSNDVVFYRHWHGPLYHYFLIPVSRVGLNEGGVRAAMLFVPALSVAAIYLGCIWLIPGFPGFLAALLSSALFLSSLSVVRSTELAPHQLFALCYLASLILLAKMMSTGRRSHWYAAVVLAGLSFCVLEVTFVLVLTLIVCAYIERRRLQVGWNFIGRSVALFVATVLLVWPSAIYKLSFVKAYLFMAYLALFRKSPWGNVGVADTWRSRFLSSPLEWAMVAVAIVFFFRKRESNGRVVAYPAIVFAVLMLAATARVLSETSRYSLPFMPALDLFAGLTLASFLSTRRKPAALAFTVLAGAGLYGVALLQLLEHPRNQNPRPLAVLDDIHGSNLTGKALLVPQDDLPMIHYYFPATQLRGYYTDRPAPADLEGFMPDGILYPGYPVRLDRLRAP